MRDNAPLGWGEVLTSLAPSFMSGQTSCVLLRSPVSTGKRTVAEYLATQAGVPAMDRRLFPQPYWTDEKGRRSTSGGARLVEPELSMSLVRDLLSWVSLAPSSRAGRVAIVRLDHTRQDGSTWAASARVQEALLKTLEEPPVGVRFFILAAGSVVPTIESRCVIVRSGLLRPDVVADILYRVSDLDERDSRVAAALGNGQVAASLSAKVDAVGAREAVLGFFSDVLTSDMGALDSRAKGWTDIHTKMLLRALHEIVTRQFSAFSVEDLSGVSVPLSMKILTLLHRFSGARPKVLLGAVAAGAMRG